MHNIKKNLFLIKLILLALIKNKKYLKLAFVFHDRSIKFKLICAHSPIKYSANYDFFTKIIVLLFDANYGIVKLVLYEGGIIE